MRVSDVALGINVGGPDLFSAQGHLFDKAVFPSASTNEMRDGNVQRNDNAE